MLKEMKVREHVGPRIAGLKRFSCRSCFSSAVSEPKLITKRGRYGDKLKYANSLRTHKTE